MFIHISSHGWKAKSLVRFEWGWLRDFLKSDSDLYGVSRLQLANHVGLAGYDAADENQKVAAKNMVWYFVPTECRPKPVVGFTTKNVLSSRTIKTKARTVHINDEIFSETFMVLWGGLVLFCSVRPISNRELGDDVIIHNIR